MKYLFLLAALLLMIQPAAAQTPRLAARPDSLPAPLATAPAAPDTVAALHRLFAAKRRRSAVVISATVGTGLLCLVIAENTRHSYTIDATPIIVTGISLLSIPATITEIGYYRQFTHQKEWRALAALEAHQLSEKMKHLLRPEYFVAAPATGHR